MGFLNKFFGTEDTVQIESNKDFWDWFTKNEKKFYEVVKTGKNVEKNLFNVLSPQAKKLRDGYYFIAEAKDNGIAELTVTVNGNTENIVFAEDLVKDAPKLDNWSFVALKSEENDDYEVSLEGRKYNVNKIFFYSNDNPDFPHDVDITFVYNDPSIKNREVVIEGIDMFIDDYLGEMKFATMMDSFNVVALEKAEKELIPVSELKTYLDKREADFQELFKNNDSQVAPEQCKAFEIFAQDGFPVRILLNLPVVNWNKKNSYPWISTLKIQFSGLANGLPDQDDYEILNAIDDEMKEILKPENGHLYVGRETYSNVREVYFASKDFRDAARVFDQIINKYGEEYIFDTSIVKDKHWKTFAKYNIA